MLHLRNPVQLLTPDLAVTYDKKSSLLYGGPSNIILYTILHGFFTVLTMKELISILRSLVKGSGKKIRFNRILLWHMVENWEDLFKMIRLCLFPRRMYTFSSQYYSRRVPYNRLAWKRILLSGIIALFIFAMDIALISLSMSTTQDFVDVDWDFNGEIPRINDSNIRTERFNKIISVRSKSNNVEFEYPPVVLWENYNFKHMELNDDLPSFKDVSNPFFRCDTFRDSRWKVTCQTNIGGETHLYTLVLEAYNAMEHISPDSEISEIDNRTEFQSKRYKKAIEDQLNISVTSFVSTEDNFNSERSSEGQCAFCHYVGDMYLTGLDCTPRKEFMFSLENPEDQDCRLEKKDCRTFIRSVNRGCKNRSCSSGDTDKSLRFNKVCNVESCGYSCNYMGFAMGSNILIKEKVCVGEPGAISYRCHRTTDVIMSIFLHSVRIGNTDSSITLFRSKAVDAIQDNKIRGKLTSQRPVLPLYGLILIYIILQLVSIFLQTTVREHPISSEMKLLAEVCGARGVENLINMNLEDREIFFSEVANGIDDAQTGHCGYLPGRIAGDIRQFYNNKKLMDDGMMHNIISESDMEKIIEIDGRVESYGQQKT